MRMLLVISVVFFLSVAPASRAAAPVSPAQATRALLDGAAASESDAMLVMRDGKVLAEYHKPGSAHTGIEMMSVTKSLVGLAVGRLLTQGKITSLDQPVSDFYPEWKQGQKSRITLRMLLNHTSGLQNERNTSIEIYPALDGLQLALAAELSDPPGTRFAYNNKAMNLLAGVIEKASGLRMDRYIVQELLQPMGITDASWNKDGFDRAGHPYAMAGWNSTAEAALKVGQLVLDEGRWRGQALIRADYIREMVGQSQPFEQSYGLLWWRRGAQETLFVDEAGIRKFERAGVAKQPLDKLRTLLGKQFANPTELRAAIGVALGQDRGLLMQQIQDHGLSPEMLIGHALGPIVAYEGNGWHGEYIVVIPKARIVAVRQVGDRPEADQDTGWPYGYDDFTKRVIALAQTITPQLDVASAVATPADAAKPDAGK